MSATELIKKLPSAFNADSASNVTATIQFMVAQPMHTIIKDGACSVHDGVHASPDLSVTMEDSDLVDLFTGKMDGMSAFMSGKLQIEGDLMMAQAMGSYFDPAKLA